MSKFDLTKEQELELIAKAQAGDRRALEIFVDKNQGLVQKLAKGLSHYGIPHDDLVQEGNVGLLNAVSHFDPSRNARFSTIAVNYIRTPMYRFIRANARMVKCPGSKHAAKLFYTLPRMVSSADQLSDEKIAEISEELCIPEEEIKALIPFIFGTDFHITSSSDDEHQPGYVNWEQLFDDNTDELQNIIMNEEEKELIRQCIHECIDSLPDIQKDIINERWFNESGDVKPMGEIAAGIKVSHQAINIREKNAFDTLRSKIRKKLVKKYRIFV